MCPAVPGKGNDSLKTVKVIGAGLAGSEAAWQLARRGIPVELYEMKPVRRSPAHQSDLFAELVCSNSLRADRLENAVGLLKEELRRFDSLCMRAAAATSVPAGGALAVDRVLFSQFITDAIEAEPLITVIREEVTSIPEGPCIVATGPLTDGALFEDLTHAFGEGILHFHDAMAPLIEADSIDMEIAFRATRYGKGEADYLNCPMTKEEYIAFNDALVSAETAPLHSFEEDPTVFEGCMPIETMAQRGPMTIAYGPLRPVGLTDPRTGRRPFAVVQLRQDDRAGSLYNMVGFQTRLKYGEQKRVFSMIPGLEHARFARYGVMHRNTYLQSPGKLNEHFQWIERPDVFFAGQITGVEGYVESMASGLVAAVSLAAILRDRSMPDFSQKTMLGSLGFYIAHAGGKLEPMHANFALMEPLPRAPKQKKPSKLGYSERSFAYIEEHTSEFFE